MSYNEDQPRTIFSSTRKVAAARKDHPDGCVMCGRVIVKGQSYWRFTGMNDEAMVIETTRIHLGCGR